MVVYYFLRTLFALNTESYQLFRDFSKFLNAAIWALPISGRPLKTNCDGMLLVGWRGGGSLQINRSDTSLLVLSCAY